MSAVSRHGLHGGSWAIATLASTIICSGPEAHMTARSMARAESNDAVPSIGTWSNEAASTIAAHRSAAAVCPVKAVIQPASTASGGYPSTAESPSAESHRWTVDIWPALYVGSTRAVTSWTHRSRSLVFNRCSTASAGDPFDSYQSAARRCSFDDDVGLDASQLTEEKLPVQRVVAEPLPATVERDQERVRRLQARSRACPPDSPRTASHSGAHS